MREFVSPQIRITELTPADSLMDDITSSGEFPGLGDNETVVPDPGAGDEAVW